MSTSSNKRKPTEEFSNGEGAERPPPALRKGAAPAATQDQHHLPAPVWGHVFDYMPYEEVRSALLICKMFANEAAKYIRALNIMKPCQLIGPPARRFSNIEEVNCLCLVRGSEAEMMERNLTLCVDTSTRLVPFLTIFPKLKRVFAGGIHQNRWGTGRTNASDCQNPPNHTEVFGALACSFLGAFKTQLLPSTMVSVGGITNSLADIRKFCRGCYETSSVQQCSFCRDLCTYFPIREVYEVARDEEGVCQCSDAWDVYALLAKRKGIQKIFDDDASSQFQEMIVDAGNFFSPTNPKGGLGKDREKVVKLLWRLKESGVDMSAPFKVLCLIEADGAHVDYPTLKNVDELIAFGFDPKLVSKETLQPHTSVLQPRLGINNFAVHERQTLDALIARGFHFEPNNLVVIDAKDVALLQKYFENWWGRYDSHN